MERLALRRLALLLALATLTALSGCGPKTTSGTHSQSQPPPPPGEAPPPGEPPAEPAYDLARMTVRFAMTRPGNDDFAFNDDEVFVYVRPFKDHLSFKVQGREQNFVTIHWEDSELIGVLGRRYKIVPPEVTLSEATIGIPYNQLAAGELYSARLTLLDPTDQKTVRRLGGKPFPVVPEDAGGPLQLRGQAFSMRLALEINNVRRDYDMEFEIRDVVYR